MKKILLIVLLLPLFGHAQSERVAKLEENRIDHYSNDSIMRSYWHVLSRGTIVDHLNIFFRISSVNGAYSLELKVMNAGNGIVIARNAPLDLLLDNGRKVTLYNSEYAVTCRGCGATGYGGSDAPGITLSYPIPKKEMDRLQYSYVDQVKLYCGDGYWMKKVNDNNSEVFIGQVDLVLNSGIR